MPTAQPPGGVLWSIVAGWIRWLSIPFGAMSAISAVTRIFDVGIVGFARDMLEFYRQALSPIYSIVESIPLPFEVEPLLVDTIAVYCVLVSMSYRAGPGLLRRTWNYPFFETMTHPRYGYLFWGFPLLLPLATAAPIRRLMQARADLSHPAHQRENDPFNYAANEIALQKSKLVILELLLFPLGIVVFYLLNYI